MPNLDNIFNKFFPQSQTGSKGKFLIRMAWAVEILVAFIGLCIGIIVISFIIRFGFIVFIINGR